MFVTLPPVLELDGSRHGNPIRLIAKLATRVEGTLPGYTNGRTRGFLFQPSAGGGETLILNSQRNVPDDIEQVVIANDFDPLQDQIDLSGGKWVRHPLTRAPGAALHERKTEILRSWRNAFSYIQEDTIGSVPGLRRGQIGAIHSVMAHWALSKSVATVVMPTGTGKTEVMLSLLVAGGCATVLVIVPTDALRAQLTGKFLTLGILKAPGSGVLAQDARCPIVCTLLKIPRSEIEVDDIFQDSQVVIATSAIAAACEDAIKDRIARHCTHLFIDEAHHAEAPSWRRFKDRFAGHHVLQFTATPFREDGRVLDGKIVFSYRLSQAQEDGYFRPIRFRPVVQFNRARADHAIAEAAIDQLRLDYDRGHIAMARVDSVARAREIFELYARYPEFNPVQLHTGLSATVRRQAREAIIVGISRVVVCVDMLGEGFDLPQLKIAAFHDIRRTLAVTLQLAGRFTRTLEGLGDATFIANTAYVDVQEELRKLYTRDPDWNVLLPQLSERLIGEQQSLQEFLSGFNVFSREVPLKNVRPATSAVVYRTTCEEWNPVQFRRGIPGIEECEQVYESINEEKRVLVVVTGRRESLPWFSSESIYDLTWDLFVVFWSREKNLLFINSSANSGEYAALARAIVGEGAALINGQAVFRSFAGITRLRLQNVGLTEQLGRNIRYTGRMGADVEPALTELHRRRALKSVIAGGGYERGAQVSMGASRRGRVWSHSRDRIDQLLEWSLRLGDKLLNAEIDPDEVLRGTLEAQRIEVRPTTRPVGVDWPEVIYQSAEMQWRVYIDGAELSLNEVDIDVIEGARLDASLRFSLIAEGASCVIELSLYRDGDVPNYRYIVQNDREVFIRKGDSPRVDVSAFFYENPPFIWFADGSFLEGNQYVPLKGQRPPYQAEWIDGWHWDNVDIRRESQGVRKDPQSIQKRVIDTVLQGTADIVFDDDGKGEAADVISVTLIGNKETPEAIEVSFFHCKYSAEAVPGSRIEDLYEVCGQAQKSVNWMSSSSKRTDLFTHMLSRDERRRLASGIGRFERGDAELTHMVRDMSRFCPVTLRIIVVQPGLSKQRVSQAQLEILGVTKNASIEI